MQPTANAEGDGIVTRTVPQKQAREALALRHVVRGIHPPIRTNNGSRCASVQLDGFDARLRVCVRDEEQGGADALDRGGTPVPAMTRTGEALS